VIAEAKREADARAILDSVYSRVQECVA